MPADRFYAPGPLLPDETFRIEGPEHHHLAHVMRISRGDEIEVVNGKGTLVLALVETVQKQFAEGKILSVRSAPPPNPPFSLGIPLMRPAKLEWAVEKGTELGAAAFYFYPAENSEKDELSPRHLERLHLLSVSALKQSGRLYLPSIEIVSSLPHLFTKEKKVYYGDTGAAPRFEAPEKSDILFITGPEKGFSQDELILLREKGKGVSLSPHILRAETAPLAAAAFLGARQS